MACTERKALLIDNFFMIALDFSCTHSYTCSMSDGWLDLTPAGYHPWESVPVGPKLAEVVAGVDAGELSAQDRVSYMRACDTVVSWAQGQAAYATAAAAHAVLRATDAVDDHGYFDSRAHAWAVDEIAAALHVAPITASRRIRWAQVICEEHPRLWAAVNAGQLTWSQACALTDVITTTDVGESEPGVGDHRDVIGEALHRVLPTAGGYPPARLKARMATAICALSPQSQAKTRRKVTKNLTGVSVWAVEHGLATLGITGMAVDIEALRILIHAQADARKTAHGHRSGNNADHETDHETATDRTIGQWRVAAVLATFGLAPMGMPASPTDPCRADGPPAVPGVDVKVVVDLPTLLGLAENPGELPGYGPIDPELSRQLSASGDWSRWVTDPVTGYLLDDGTRRFPSAGLARYIRARDARCGTPACTRTTNLDVDHTPTWASTHTTNAQQLALACIRHNRSRDANGWDTPHPNTWTTLGGRTYLNIPHQVLPRHGDPDDEPIPF